MGEVMIAPQPSSPPASQVPALDPIAVWNQSAVELDRIDASVTVGRTIDDAMAFQLAIGPAGEIVREARELGDVRRPVIEEELRALMGRLETADGVAMGSSSWCVTARVST
jgi:hypothetical protein